MCDSDSSENETVGTASDNRTDTITESIEEQNDISVLKSHKSRFKTIFDSDSENETKAANQLNEEETYTLGPKGELISEKLNNQFKVIFSK